MSEKNEHLSKDFKSVHKSVGTVENGACLWGHKAGFSKNSCCYRWQAHEHAKEDDEIFVRYKTQLPFDEDDKIKTLASRAESGKMFPAHYCSFLDPPKDGDWDVEGPPKDIVRKNFKRRTVRVKATKNFTKDTWPYWNNAHHIIPKGTLVTKIDEDTKAVVGAALFVKKALMVALYNVNHKTNLVFLPQDKEVADILGVPRHLALNHTDDAPDNKSECFDHKLYNEHVAQKLTSINKEYLGKFEDAKKKNKKHPELAANLDKTKLEDVSVAMYKKIKGGKGAFKRAGKPLTALFKPKK